MRGIREDIERDRQLARVKPQNDQRVGKQQNGLRWKEGSTAATVFYCERCRAPVTNSVQGRKMHAMRKPECAAAVGV